MNRTTLLYALFLMFVLAASPLMTQQLPVDQNNPDQIDDQPVDDEIVVDTIYIPPYMEGVGYYCMGFTNPFQWEEG